MVIITEEPADGPESSASARRDDDDQIFTCALLGGAKKQAKLERDRVKRQKKKERKKQRKITDPKCWGKNMDPEVWGNLPPNLTLEMFKKLPLRSFYQLREVCREWNRVACERRCVTDPIHKPYFVLVHEGDDEYTHYDHYLHGIMTFHIKSGHWRWNALRPIPIVHTVCPMYTPFSVKGLTFSCDSPERYRVFDAHTRQEYIVPRQPKVSRTFCAVGMAVEPHTFKVIVGSLDMGTQVYDSVTKKWETKPSRLVPCQDCIVKTFKTCCHIGDRMYIWADVAGIMIESNKVFLVYSLSEDKWSTLEPPLHYESDSYRRGLGSWQGRIFTVTYEEKCDHLGEDEYGFPMRAHLAIIWELLDDPKPNDRGDESRWEAFDEMPIDMQKWLIPFLLHENDEVQVAANFCDEHMLIYSWVPEEGRAYRFVLYNLATKTWEKVEAPNRAVSITPDDEQDTWKRNCEHLFASLMGLEEFWPRSLLNCTVGGNSCDFEYDDDSSDESWYWT